MKKLIIGAALIASLATGATSCGSGNKEEVNNDSIVGKELVDSLSEAIGAFMGVNLQDEVSQLDDINEYVEGYQLAAGHNYSRAQLAGMRAGLYMSEQFMMMAEDGVKIDRDKFLREFRKYLQDKNIDQAEHLLLYNRVQELEQSIIAILEKREQMRNADRGDEEVVADEEVVELEMPENLDENDNATDSLAVISVQEDMVETGTVM